MNSLRLARVALRARPAAIRVPLQRRTYAEAVPDKASRHQAEPGSSPPGMMPPETPERKWMRCDGIGALRRVGDVVQVNLPADSGEMGVLANHVPSIEQLKPGLVEIIEETGGAKQFFLSGGFATVQPNSILSINAVEGFPLEDFSAEAVKNQIAEATKVANGSGSEQDIAEAKIELEVLETLAAHGRRVDSGFAKPASRNTLVEERPSLPLEETYHGIGSQRKSHRHGHGLEERASSSVADRFDLSKANLGRLRSSTSTNQLRTSRTIGHHRDKSLGNPRAADLLQPSLRGPFLPPSSLPTHGSASVSTTGKIQDAMEIFEQYGISRPAGWLSEDASAASGTPDMPHMKVFRVCHSCGEPLASRKYCPHCGHDSCLKCTSEIPDEELDRTHESIRQHEESTFQHLDKQTLHHVQTANQNHERSTLTAVDIVRQQETSESGTGVETPKALPELDSISSKEIQIPVEDKIVTHSAPSVPKPIVSSRSVKNNPFFIADKLTKSGATEPTTTARNALANRPVPPSDCVPRREIHRSSNHSKTHADNPPRYDIGCRVRESVAQQAVDSESSEVADLDEESTGHSPSHSSLQDPVERKIDQLYHHAEDLHRSQHIVEHLAAGTKRLRHTALQQKWEGMQGEPNQTTIRQPSRDHSLIHDSIAIADFDMPIRSPRRDEKVPEPRMAETHRLTDDIATDREPSPRSHDLPEDIRTKVAELIEPHSISHDPGFKAQSESIQPPRPSLPILKPISPGALISRHGAKVLPSDPSVPKPFAVGQNTLEEGAEMTLEKPTLRKGINAVTNHGQVNTETSGIASWRNQLRKVDKWEERPREKRLTPPVVKWRRSLSKLSPAVHSDTDRGKTCTFCRLSESSSSKHPEATPRLVAEDTTGTPEYMQQYSAKLQNPRVRLKQVELSLAHKSVEDLAGEYHGQAEKEVVEIKEVGAAKRSKTASHSSSEEMQSITEIHSPRPVLPPEHVCAWRTRCMDLNTEVNQLKSEASSQPVVKPEDWRRDGGRSHVGVGTDMDQHQCPEISIEGLTIVMHMRGKDDLVINTNLKNEGVTGHGKSNGNVNGKRR
ncbi:hypothetical protein AK830_g3951 [Neonectria ditissima]|uniref:ATP synthase subunit delta, mitochondrial n=1 Tax=Neonectria ditissima TaxID=78410 RepID=A0A0N8H7S6_9HYPO|nr:hypothetical protein AK830_g3951 [Neonectria ditissima]